MTVRRLAGFVLLLCVALALPLTAAAAPNSAPGAALQPCAPGAVYDPACDVDHDGDVDIFDIQLTAGHWNRNGAWTGGDYWALLGNAGTNPAVNFLGTSDNQPLVAGSPNPAARQPRRQRWHRRAGDQPGVRPHAHGG